MIKYFLLFILLFSCAHPDRSPSNASPPSYSCTNAIDTFFTISWPENKLSSLISKRIQERNFNNEEWYEYLNSNPIHLEKYLENKIKNPYYIEKIKRVLGEEYVVLLMHPGLLSRFDDFINFSKTIIAHNGSKILPHHLYLQYSNHLGTMKLFRGMALENDQIAQELMNQGLSAGLIRQSPNQGVSPITQELMQKTPGRVQPYLLEMHQHIRGGSENSRYISASHYIEVAASVGFSKSPKIGSPSNKRLYLYEMEIPKIEVIEFKEYFKDIGSSQLGYFTIDDKKYYFSDPQVEYLIPYFINKDWIKKVHRYENPPSPWRYFR